MSLKAHRLNAGMSVAELAKFAETSKGAIYYMERTGSRPRDAATAKQIADLFDVRVTDLWPIENDEPVAA